MENNNQNKVKVIYSKFVAQFIIFIQVSLIICMVVFAGLAFFSREYQGMNGLGLAMMIFYLIIILLIFDIWGKNYSTKKIKEYSSNNQIIPNTLKILEITSSWKIIIIYLALSIFISKVFLGRYPY